MGSKNRESPSPEGKEEACVGLVGFWHHMAPGHQNGVGAKSDQGSIRAAGAASSLSRSAGAKMYGGHAVTGNLHCLHP
eukprot:1157887-Pelagomonas_calceolata.AAC.2